jgi:negative regulator of sigma-B (phosphoserine phosphatase)
MESMSARREPIAVPMLVEFGIGARALRGEHESGDLHLVAPYAGGVLIAVADGLGHGPEAAAAARMAIGILQDSPAEPVIDVVRRCHAALLKTRGVVLSLASIDAAAHQMTWLGVGNVDGTLYRADSAARPQRESLAMRGGVVGYQMPSLRAAVVPIAPGDTLTFATDGIAREFHSLSPLGWHPQDAADHILRRYGKDNDDALILIARYQGTAS